MSSHGRKWLGWLAILLVLGGLIAWALRHVPLAEIWHTVRRLQPGQILILLGVNTMLYVLVSLRWWIIVRAEAGHVPYLPLLVVRVAVFGVSYFTLGPQIGGEPLQVFSLQRRYQVTFARATATVLLDKLLEFLVDFLLLALGLTAVLQAGLYKAGGGRFPAALFLPFLLAFIPPVHLFLLYHRRYPLTWILHRLPFQSRFTRPVRFLRAAERLAGSFCQRHLRALLAALGVSLLAGAGMLADYALMTSFLGIQLPFWKTVAGWTAGWLAFLFPLPGGLGVLEASQVFALGAFGIPAAAALGLAVLMRGRDLLIGGLGLLLAPGNFRRPA